MKRKLSTYLDFVVRGQLGPQGVVPRILVSTVTTERRDAIRAIVSHLPDPAPALMRIETADKAATRMLRSLRD